MSTANELYRCRLCTKYSEFHYSIFDEDIVELVENLTSIKMNENDDLPSTSCAKCLDEVHKAHLLRNRIIQSHKVLQEQLQAMKSEGPSSRVVFMIKKESAESDSELEMADEAVEAYNSSDSPEYQYEEPTEEDTYDNIKDEVGEAEDSQIEDSQLEEESQVMEEEDVEEEEEVTQNEIDFEEVEDHHYPEITINPDINNSLKARLEKKRAQDLKTRKPSLGGDGEPTDLSLYKGQLIGCYKCFDCNTDYKVRKEYLIHMKQHATEVKCKVCHIDVNEGQYRRHMDIHQSGPQVCQLCGTVAKNIESLRGHLFYMHKSSADQYQCQDCNKFFRFKYKYTLHMRKYHQNGSKTHVCEVCGKGFYTFRDCKRHNSSTHEKIRPYICEFCNKGFSSAYARRTHVRQHTNEKPFKCDLCAEGFRQRVSLKTHYRSKHDVEYQSDANSYGNQYKYQKLASQSMKTVDDS